MVTFIGEEGRNTGRSVRGVVVGKLGEGQEFGPVVLLVGTVVLKILLKRLVSAFGLTISLGIVPRREVDLDT